MGVEEPKVTIEYGVYFNTLPEDVDPFSFLHGVVSQPGGLPVVMSCERGKRFKNPNDLMVDTPCPCGNPNHWLVFWHKEPAEEAVGELGLVVDEFGDAKVEVKKPPPDRVRTSGMCLDVPGYRRAEPGE